MKKTSALYYIFCLLPTIVTGLQSPYAPEKVGTHLNGSQIGTYRYDTANNRLSNGLGQTITMGLVTKPVTIKKGAETQILKYGIDGARYLSLNTDGRKTFYLENAEYRISALGVHSSIMRVRAKGYSPDVQIDVTNHTDPQYTYFIKDHLGSPVSSVGPTNSVDKRTRFDPWGRMTEATGVAQDLSNTADVEATRGYTGHETIASADLIQMNARVFDPVVGLFLGPDRFIQGRSIASVNRLILGHNNNPNVTDPSGWVTIPHPRIPNKQIMRIARSESVVEWENFVFRPTDNLEGENIHTLNTRGRVQGIASHDPSDELIFRAELEEHNQKRRLVTNMMKTRKFSMLTQEYERLGPPGTGTQIMVDAIDAAEHLNGKKPIHAIKLTNVIEPSFREVFARLTEEELDTLNPVDFQDNAWAKTIRRAAERKGYTITSQELIDNRSQGGIAPYRDWQFNLRRSWGYKVDTEFPELAEPGFCCKGR